MKDILVVVIVAYIAFTVGGYYIKDVAIKYVDDKCNTLCIIETHKGHFYECKSTDKSIDNQMNKE